jgi:hypothetical protein
MYCPQCGQRQATNEARFCSGCGFSLNVVVELLANSGQLPWRQPTPGGGQLSPRQKGIRQGAFLMLSTVVVLPIIIFLGVALFHLPGVLIPLAAVTCVMGGLLRIIYAALFESNETMPAGAAPQYVPPAMPPNYLGAPQAGAALPPPQSAPIPAYRRPQRLDTGELPAPPTASVTDHTTRLLDKQPDDRPKQ